MTRAISRRRPDRGSLITAALVTSGCALWLAFSLHRAMESHHGVTAFARAVTRTGGGVALAALPVTGLIAMLPCLLQMSVVLTAVAGTAPQPGADPRRGPGALSGAARVLLGYLAVYTAVGLVLGSVGRLFLAELPLWRALAGLLLVLLGLAAADLLPVRLVRRCRGPIGFLLQGPHPGRPLAMGAAFAVYCAGCCGPYLYALAAVAGSTGSPWRSAALAAAFATGTALLLALPTLALPAARALVRRLGQGLPDLARVCGLVLAGIGVLLILEETLLPRLAGGV